VTPAPEALAAAVRHGFEPERNPRRAAGAQAYLKTTMPFYGLSAAVLRRVCRQAFADHPLSTAADWRTAIAVLWDRAEHREDWYAAIELARHKPYQRFLSLALLPLCRRMIREGAWWDTVDAWSVCVGALLERYPDQMNRTLRAWARQDDRWLRRTAIIAQTRRRDQTDLELLAACIEPSLESREFFLRKAIGWALRELAKGNPALVRKLLATYGDRLSPLSRREALKGFAFVERHGLLRHHKR